MTERSHSKWAFPRWHNTQSESKVTEMKSNILKVGMTIGTLMLTGLLVVGIMTQSRTTNPAVIAGALPNELVIDMDQELGSSDTEVRVARSPKLVIDMDQELGSSDTEVKVVVSHDMVFDAEQEGGAPILR
ncbi:MAG: hypothetical protein ACE5Q6_01335 [Dehalococcoidia bacterium]